MSGTINARLTKLNIELPQGAAPIANYVPYVISGNLVFVSGQVTLWNGELQYVGKLGQDFGVDEGYQAARLCGLNLIAQARNAADGDLDSIQRVVRLGGFVNSTSAITDQPKVINGASDLMVEVFGKAGQHARVALSASSLPFGVAVEVEATFELG